jgi:hypothetical protein
MQAEQITPWNPSGQNELSVEDELELMAQWELYDAQQTLAGLGYELERDFFGLADLGVGVQIDDQGNWILTFSGSAGGYTPEKEAAAKSILNKIGSLTYNVDAGDRLDGAVQVSVGGNLFGGRAAVNWANGEGFSATMGAAIGQAQLNAGVGVTISINMTQLGSAAANGILTLGAGTAQ